LLGTGAACVEPGDPWASPYLEIFRGKLGDDVCAREVFDSIVEASVLFDDCRSSWG
jgi:hypothetical protein